jgi:hypothetical protein
MARASDPHRAEGKFGHFAGWYGHGDCPSPDSHWDPGALRWSELFRVASAMPAASAAPTPLPVAPPRPCAHAAAAAGAALDERSLSPGTTQGSAIAAPAPAAALDLSAVSGLQRALNALGYKLDVDGDFGRETEGALKSFQMHVGLAADGVVGPVTISALEQELRGG